MDSYSNQSESTFGGAIQDSCPEVHIFQDYHLIFTIVMLISPHVKIMLFKKARALP
ncbi:hypothetical protein BCAR13_1840019 [Paraburkholderia caribensis]|nr:hypothetical protein BCAR13_1840019 [Paraburkholderia caribensis]